MSKKIPLLEITTDLRKIMPALVFAVVFVVFIAQRAPAEAQFSIPEFDEVISMTIIPPSPKPNEKFTIVLRSSSVDLESSSISWSAGGRTAGAKSSVELTAPPAGRAINVSVSVISLEGVGFRKSLSLSPAGVDILWQADTYTPPLYRGGALHSVDSNLKAVAMPNFINSNGAPVNPANLIYTWKLNSEIRGSESGLGKSSFSWRGSMFFRPSTIEVEVRTRDGSLSAAGSATVEIENPRIIFYEDSPVSGINYEKALSGEISSGQKEVSVVAEPYYFSGSSPVSGALEYNWGVGGRKAEASAGRKNVITLRNESGGEVSSQVSLEVKNLGRFLQFARENFSARLSGQSDLSI